MSENHSDYHGTSTTSTVIETLYLIQVLQAEPIHRLLRCLRELFEASRLMDETYQRLLMFLQTLPSEISRNKLNVLSINFIYLFF